MKAKSTLIVLLLLLSDTQGIAIRSVEGLENDEYPTPSVSEKPKNIDSETLTSMAMTELAVNDARNNEINEQRAKEEKEYQKAHPKPIQE